MNKQGIFTKENIKKGVYIYTENSNFILPKFWGLHEENETPVGAVIIADRNLLVSLNGSDGALILLKGSADLASDKHVTIEDALKDMNGAETSAQLAEMNSPASLFCKKYKCGHIDNWYLPTLSDMQLMYDHKKDLDIALAIVGGNAIETDDWHWTSTRRHDSSHWVFGWVDGDRFYNLQDYDNRVRPVSAFL